VLLRKTSCVDLVVQVEVGTTRLEVEVELVVPDPVGIMDLDFVVLSSAGTVKDQLEVIVPELAG
jgi:hypothetical protein